MNRSLLFVDDDPQILEGFKRTLRKHYAVRTCLGGPEALDVIAQGEAFGVIVADMQMPDMSGVEFFSVFGRWQWTVSALC